MPPWSGRGPSRSSAGCGSRRGNRRTRTPAPRAAAAARRTGGRSTAATVRTVEARARWGATGGGRSVRSPRRVVTRAPPGRGGAKTARTKPTQNRATTARARTRTRTRTTRLDPAGEWHGLRHVADEVRLRAREPRALGAALGDHLVLAPELARAAERVGERLCAQ